MFHLHISTEFSECFGTGIEHFIRVTDMITNPQGNAAREEGQVVIAFVDSNLCIWMVG